jgi:hypothetical protein
MVSYKIANNKGNNGLELDLYPQIVDRLVCATGLCHPHLGKAQTKERNGDNPIGRRNQMKNGQNRKKTNFINIKKL